MKETKEHLTKRCDGRVPKNALWKFWHTRGFVKKEMGGGTFYTGENTRCGRLGKEVEGQGEWHLAQGLWERDLALLWRFFGSSGEEAVERDLADVVTWFPFCRMGCLNMPTVSAAAARSWQERLWQLMSALGCFD